MYQCKAKRLCKVKDYAQYLGNISEDFTINIKTKTRLKRVAKCFYVNLNTVDTNDILDIDQYLMKIT